MLRKQANFVKLEKISRHIAFDGLWTVLYRDDRELSLLLRQA